MSARVMVQPIVSVPKKPLRRRCFAAPSRGARKRMMVQVGSDLMMIMDMATISS
jgi:hypothetical protein